MSNAADKQRKALGKGYRHFCRQRTAPSSQPLPAAAAPAPALRRRRPRRCRSTQIHPNPLQPRVVFQPDRLEELAASIRANGIIQPLIVRRHQGAIPADRR